MNTAAASTRRLSALRAQPKKWGCPCSKWRRQPKLRGLLGEIALHWASLFGEDLVEGHPSDEPSTAVAWLSA